MKHEHRNGIDMRIGRFEVDGRERIGLFKDGSVQDITTEFDSFQDALSPTRCYRGRRRVLQCGGHHVFTPTTDQNTVFCGALNYEAHAEESNIDVPERPLIFMKLPRTLVGHQEPISYHTKVTREIDYEAELAAVIGEPARHVSPDEALEYVAGYTIINDTSARDLQLVASRGRRNAGLVLREDHATDDPVGPYVVTDEIDDPQDLHIASRVNEETLQDDNTGMMIRSVADLVSFVSSRVRLEPGDIIATGTPEGLGPSRTSNSTQTTP